MMRTGYRLWNDGDIDGMVARCLHSEVEFHPSPEWPGVSSVYQGHDEVGTFLKDEVAGVIGLTDIEIERELVMGEEVVFALRTRVHGELSGVQLEMEAVYHVTRVEEGKVKRIRAFLTEDEAISAAKGT
jgi:hypothetical protein